MEGTVCCLNEEAYSAAASAVEGGPSQDKIEEIAMTLHSQGDINVAALKKVAQEKDKLVSLMKDIVEESIYSLEEVYNEAVALAAAAEMEHVLETANATTVISPHIEQDDHEEESRKQPDGSIKTVKKRIKGTVKEAIRGLKSSISVSKLLSVDP